MKKKLIPKVKSIMKIKVCQTHIDKGTPHNIKSCPIALAIKDHPTIKKLKKNLRVRVTDDSVTIDNTGPRYLLSSRAKRFITRFDEGFKVKPFSFEIDLHS